MCNHSVVSDSLQSHELRSPPGSSVHGILQARILEWVVISFSRGFPNPGVEPISSASPELAGRFFITEPPEKPLLNKSASLVAQRLKRLPAIWETQVRSLGWEDPLEKKMATHSSILAWRIPWMEEPGGLQSTGSQRVRHD